MSAVIALVAVAAVVVLIAMAVLSRRPCVVQPCSPFGAQVSDGSVLAHSVGSEVAFEAVVKEPFAITAAGGVGLVTLTGPPGYQLYSVALDPQTGRIASKRPMPGVTIAGQTGDDVWVYGFKLKSMDEAEFVMLDM